MEMITVPAPRGFTLNIDADTIERSERDSQIHCAIATALREQHDAWSVKITADSIRFNVGGEKHRGDKTVGTRYSFPCPAEVSAAVIKFDKTGKMAPFKAVLSKNQCVTGNVAVRAPHQKKSHPNRRKKPRFCPTTRRFHGTHVIQAN